MHRSGFSPPLALLTPLFAAVFAAACSGDDAISPGDAKPSDLLGYWYNVETPPTGGAGVVRVFGFTAADDAPWTTEYVAEPPETPVSMVYLGSEGTPFSLMQLASFDVQDGFLHQTVIGDVGAVPGTRYRSRIFEITPRGRMVLESDSGAMGRRTFTWSDRCFPQTANRLHDLWGNHHEPVGDRCPNPLANAAALAVDEHGGVHNITGVQGDSSFGRCTPFPTYGYWNGNCEPVGFTVPGMRGSALALDADNDSVHYAYVTLEAGMADDNVVLYRKRPLRGEAWTEERVGALTSALQDMVLRVRGDDETLLVAETNGALGIHRRTASGWSRAAAQTTTGAPLTLVMAGAAFDDAGKLVIVSEQPAKLALERTANTFEVVDLPKPIQAGDGAGVVVGADGVAHVVWTYEPIGDNASGVGGRVISGKGVYGRYDGMRWQTSELGPTYHPRLALDPRGVPVLLAAEKKARIPRFLITRLERDGSRPSFAMTLEDDFGVGSSMETFWHPRIAIGRDGTIAATATGEHLFVRSPRQWPEAKRTVTFTFSGNGTGRVVSNDGRIACESTCTVEADVGERFEIRVEPAAGSIARAVPCTPAFLSLYGGCGIVVSSDPRMNEHRIDLVRTSVSDLVPVGLLADSTEIDDYHVLSGRLSLLVHTLSTSIDVAGHTAATTATASDQVLVLRDGDTVSATTLPAPGLVVQRRTDGSTRVVHLLLGPTTFGATRIDVASGAAQVAESVFSSAGTLVSARAIMSVPSGTEALGAAADESGNAMISLRNLTSLGTPGGERYGVLFLPATGDARLHAITTEGPSLSASITMNEGRALLTGPRWTAVVSQAQLVERSASVATALVGEISATAHGVLWTGMAATPTFVRYDASGNESMRTDAPYTQGLVAYVDSRFDGIAYLSLAETRRVITFATAAVPGHMHTFDAGGGTLALGRVVRDATGAWVHVKQTGSVSFDGRMSDERYRNVLVHVLGAAL